MTKLEQSKVDMAFRMLYGDGKNLSQIAEEVGCGVYDLSPWLLRAALEIKNQTQEDAAERAMALAAEVEQCRRERDMAFGIIRNTLVVLEAQSATPQIAATLRILVGRLDEICCEGGSTDE